MSHIVKVEAAEMQDLRPDVRALMLQQDFIESIQDIQPGQSVRLFSRTFTKGVSIKLKGWMYPVVLADNQMYFDNYNGNWGDGALIGRLKQEYQIAQVTQVARLRRRNVARVQESDGRVRLVIT